MGFSPQFLDDIRARVPLGDLIGRRVKLQKRGREFVGLCPFHNEKTPSFTVNEQKGFFHCFGCGAHGDVIGFLMRTEGVPFPEAIERLAALAGLPMPVHSPEERERTEKSETLMSVNEAACAWYEHNLRRPEGSAALDYLKGRGLSDEIIARFRLGFAPDRRDGLKSALTGQDIAEDLLVEAGLLGRPEDGRATYDRFRGRIIFPITDYRERVIAFGGRLLKEGEPKYLNSPETPLFSKGRVLYAQAKARSAAHEGKDVIIAEGYMDVIALHQAGFTGALAPLGTALTEAQIEAVWRFAKEPILCFDGDTAGRQAAARAAERALPLLEAGRSLRFSMLPDGEDPDSLIRTRGVEVLEELLARARALVDMVWEIQTAGRPADTPERRALIRKALRARAREIGDRTVQEYYFVEFESRLDAAFGTRKRTPWSGRRRRPRDSTGAGITSSGDVGILDRRHEQVLVSAIISHPSLISDVGEEFNALTLGSDELDKIRQEIINTWTPDLDTEGLRNHLKKRGFSKILERLTSKSAVEHWEFARASAELGDALSGWRYLCGRLEGRRRFDGEIEAARQAFAEEPSARNWAYLSELQRQRHDMVEEETDSDSETGDRARP